MGILTLQCLANIWPFFPQTEGWRQPCTKKAYRPRFPVAFAHLLSPYRILVILAVFPTSSFCLLW